MTPPNRRNQSSRDSTDRRLQQLLIVFGVGLFVAGLAFAGFFGGAAGAIGSLTDGGTDSPDAGSTPMPTASPDETETETGSSTDDDGSNDENTAEEDDRNDGPTTEEDDTTPTEEDDRTTTEEDSNDDETTTEEETGESNFDVLGLNTSAEVPAGETTTVDYIITNGGGSAGSTDVRVWLGDKQVRSYSVNMEPGEEEEYRHTIDTSGYEPGTYWLIVETDDDLQETRIELTEDDGTSTEEPEFSVTELNAPDEATIGDVTSVEYTVSNGGGSGSTDISVWFGDQQIRSASINMDAGEETTYQHSVDTSGYDPGTYWIVVETDHDRQEAQIELTEEDSGDGTSTNGSS